MSKIPRVIHQIWVGPPLPDRLAEMRQTWIDHHPDWQHVLWTDADLPQVLYNQVLYDDPPCPPENVGQFRADVWRYEILLEHGGVYVDMDFECLAPIDDYVGGVTSGVFAVQQEPGIVANGLIGASPGHPFVKRLVEGLSASVARHRGAKPRISTGPRYLTRLHESYRGESPLTVLPAEPFFPYGWADVGTDRARPPWPEGTVAVHHWANQHRERGIDAEDFGG